MVRELITKPLLSVIGRRGICWRLFLWSAGWQLDQSNSSISMLGAETPVLEPFVGKISVVQIGHQRLCYGWIQPITGNAGFTSTQGMGGFLTQPDRPRWGLNALFADVAAVLVPLGKCARI
jgi:hypothetical protein